MAASATIVERAGEKMQKVTWTWTSHTDGAGSFATTKSYDGKVFAVMTNPSATAPTADYDITITDADGHDILLGQGTDRHTSTTEYVFNDVTTPMAGVTGDKLTLVVANAGSGKIGVVALWIG